VKRAINNGFVIGPRMIVSGPILSPEDGQFFNLSDQTGLLLTVNTQSLKMKKMHASRLKTISLTALML
jgi:hypothetical protein